MAKIMRRESSSALKFKLKRGRGATGARIPTHPAAAAGSMALGRLGEPGKSEAVWPSSPMPSTTASKGRGTRANVSQADTAPMSGVGAPFLRPRNRAAAAGPLSSTSRTSFSLLAGSDGSTQRSSASATHTELQSSSSARSNSNILMGDFPPDTTRLASLRAAMEFLRPAAISSASARDCASMSENFLTGGSEFIMPRKSVTAEHGTGGCRSPGAGDIHFRAFVELFPGGTNRVYPRPGGVEFVPAHEQRQIPLHRVHQQPLVGVEAAGLERFVQVQGKAHGLQAHAFARILGQYGHGNAFVGLQANDQFIGRMGGARHLEYRKRDFVKRDHQFGNPILQSLAGAQVKRHARPTPRIDLDFQRYEGFGGAVRRNIGLFQVSRYRHSANRAGLVLTAHRFGQYIAIAQRPQRSQDLELLVAHAVRGAAGRRLHCHDAQQLQQVVLNHVAQGAGLVVEIAAALHAQLL